MLLNKRIALIAGIILFSIQINAQTVSGRAAKESKLDPFLSVLEYPLIKGSKWTGAVPVKNATDKPVANMVYKLLFDFTQSGTEKDFFNKPNEGLEEIARVLNLHAAAGIKKQHLKATVIVHSAASLSILNNEAYQKKFNVKNPNEDLINQMQQAGVRFVLCGQTMNIRGIKETELYKNVLIAESSKVALSKYQTLGYVVFGIAGDH